MSTFKYNHSLKKVGAYDLGGADVVKWLGHVNKI